jgi:hypothetical protein
MGRNIWLWRGYLNPTTISTIDNIVADLEKVRVVIEEIGDKPEVFWEQIHTYLQNNLFALCALDIAYHDLYALENN